MVEKKLCDCGKEAKYIIKIIQNDDECNNCKEKLHVELINTSSICDFKNCNYVPYIDEIQQVGNKYIGNGFDDHDECDHCGRRNITGYNVLVYDINDKHVNTDKFITCKCSKLAKYELFLLNSIKCSKCDNIKYKENTKLNLCSTKCRKSGWIVKEYLESINSTKVIFMRYNSKCFKCGNVEKIDGTFEGKIII